VKQKSGKKRRKRYPPHIDRRTATRTEQQSMCDCVGDV